MRKGLFSCISFILLLSFVISKQTGKEKSFDSSMEESVIMLSSSDEYMLNNKKRDYATVILFSTEDTRYRCKYCQPTEELLHSIHKLYYSSSPENRTNILFAIARIEDYTDIFRTYKIMAIPFLSAQMPPSPSNKNGEVYTSERQSELSISDMIDFFEETLPLDVSVPIPDSEVAKVLLVVGITIVIFSLFFVPGKGFVHYLTWRGSYLRICMVIVFLCMSCLPYIIIRQPEMFTETMSRKGKTIYKFFSKSNDMYTLEGGIVAFWVYMIFFAVYGMITWTGNKSTVVSVFILALCSAIFLLALMEIKKDVEYSLPFLKEIVPYTREIVFGDHRCILCKDYVKYLSSLSVGQQQKWKKYFVSLGKLFKKCFQYFVCFYLLLYFVANF